jgi:hypothetical protein
MAASFALLASAALLAFGETPPAQPATIRVLSVPGASVRPP